MTNDAMVDAWGIECAKYLKPLLFDLDAADYLSDVLSFREHETITFDNKPALKFPLKNEVSMVIINNSKFSSEPFQWTQVYYVKIVYIGK
ncbi:hypothetical protein AMEC673_00395 [Alteromonas macleodii str. 'English Channel 673']|uniref:Uncharacterized protein n=1 Tax=Alteromonas macleodii (strain English Channel 673) TaxID=1004788 RepID=A0AB32ZTG1_ALTME|nr:hypothetical protein AMEC673_00395 [Alteromonas macleodii str. 'English Channel 673']